VNRVGARLDTVSRPLTGILDGGMAVAGRLASPTGADIEPRLADRPLGPRRRSRPSAAAAAVSPLHNDVGSLPPAHAAPFAAPGAAGGLSVASSAPDGPASASREGMVQPAWALAARSTALHLTPLPAPRAPPRSLPPSLGGLGLTLLFSVLAALLATVSAARRAGGGRPPAAASSSASSGWDPMAQA
jgi:hypothetical protein